jgi:uncharacterized protein YjlB
MPNEPKAEAPETRTFADDGTVPNNPLPVLIYRGAFDFGRAESSEEQIERMFARNGWGDSWRDGIYPFVHYHSMIHEALGVARGSATVQLGGPGGEAFDIAAGDVLVLPAGTGHRGLRVSDDFVLIGAYPKAGTYDLCRASASEHARALRSIPQVPRPDADPVHGRSGPLIGLWPA